MKFSVPDMSCGHCTSAIEKAVKSKAPEAEVSCDLSDHTVAIEGVVPAETAEAAIREAGYEPTRLDT